MTRDDILRMAREAQTAMLAQGRGVSVWNDGAYVGEVQEFCERFAALVAAAEREQCAKVCDSEVEKLTQWHPREARAVGVCADTIRARGEK
jgi:hypothetical protein